MTDELLIKILLEQAYITCGDPVAIWAGEVLIARTQQQGDAMVEAWRRHGLREEIRVVTDPELQARLDRCMPEVHKRRQRRVESSWVRCR